MRDDKMYTTRQAQMLGRREVCGEEGHRFLLPDLTTLRGGVLGVNAVCDRIKCRRCDVVFTATYPALEERA